MLGKAELMEAIAPQNRGLLTSPLERQAIQAAIARLEDRNPTPRPLETPELLEGNWRLLYTTSQELLGLDRLPLVRLGPIYQCIRLQQQRIFNLAEVFGPPLLNGLVSVSAQITPASERRVLVSFERGVLGLQSWLGYESPSQFIQKLMAVEKFPVYQGIDFRIQREQSGWLDITYLDQDTRIGRGNEGNVFVLRKVL